MSDFIKRLQDKPQKTRTRILWVASCFAAIVVFTVWFTTFKNELGKINGSELAELQAQVTLESEPHYLKVTRAEFKDNNLSLYFDITNDTDDILNFSKNSEITLTANGEERKPTQITDRQNNPYVQKALSRSQTFGILKFDLSDTETGKITFDNLYFEQSPQTRFKETISLDFVKLQTTQTIRN